jgi:hypothetical protein
MITIKSTTISAITRAETMFGVSLNGTRSGHSNVSPCKEEKYENGGYTQNLPFFF